MSARSRVERKFRGLIRAYRRTIGSWTSTSSERQQRSVEGRGERARRATEDRCRERSSTWEGRPPKPTVSFSGFCQRDSTPLYLLLLLSLLLGD